jgi:hypothetical protein
MANRDYQAPSAVAPEMQGSDDGFTGRRRSEARRTGPNEVATMASSDLARAPEGRARHGQQRPFNAGFLVTAGPAASLTDIKHVEGVFVVDARGATVYGPQGGRLVLLAATCDGIKEMALHFEEHETESGPWMVLTMSGEDYLRVLKSPRDPSTNAEGEARAHAAMLVEAIGGHVHAHFNTPVEMEARLRAALLPSYRSMFRPRSTASAGARTRRAKGGTH